jgi:hypothetical protein
MRQRTLTIFNPCQIENINEATAQAAALVPIGLGHRRSAALRAHVFAARKRLVDIHDRNHLITSKKIRSRLLRTRFPYGARCTSDRAAIVDYIVTAIGAVKLTNSLRFPPDFICSFYLNGDLLGAIAQAALEGAHVWSVWP